MTTQTEQRPRRLASLFGPDDVLADYPSAAVAQWYRRLAASSEAHGGVLAPLMLRLWLDNRDPRAKRVIAPHPNLTNSAVVRDAIATHRSVYLTEKKPRRAGDAESWGGVIPRLQGAGYPKWDGAGDLSMSYQALAAYSDLQTASFAFNAMSLAEADVFTSLHNFQLRTDVIVALAQGPGGKTTVIFKRFQARAIDRYDWDPAKHLDHAQPRLPRAGAVGDPPRPATDRRLPRQRQTNRERRSRGALRPRDRTLGHLRSRHPGAGNDRPEPETVECVARSDLC